MQLQSSSFSSRCSCWLAENLALTHEPLRKDLPVMTVSRLGGRSCSTVSPAAGASYVRPAACSLGRRSSVPALQLQLELTSFGYGSLHQRLCVKL